MNAIASLHSRALAGDPIRDPHLMHGVLLMLELGVDPVGLGQAVGLPSATLLGRADDARRGDCIRAKAWMGERLVSEVQAEREWPAGIELFKTPWHRAAIELMARPQGALTSELKAVLDEFGLVQSSKLLQRLRATLERDGFPSRVEPNAVMSNGRYGFDDATRDRVIALMANCWVVK